MPRQSALENAVKRLPRRRGKSELVDTQLIFPEAEVPRDSNHGDLSSTLRLGCEIAAHASEENRGNNRQIWKNELFPHARAVRV